MSDVLTVAETDLEAAQSALDADPDSRPAQVDYEGKLAVYEALAASERIAPSGDAEPEFVPDAGFAEAHPDEPILAE